MIKFPEGHGVRRIFIRCIFCQSKKKSYGLEGRDLWVPSKETRIRRCSTARSALFIYSQMKPYQSHPSKYSRGGSWITKSVKSSAIILSVLRFAPKGIEREYL